MSDAIKSKSRNLLGDIHPAVIAAWAALIAVGNILPTLPILGTGGSFSVSAALLPLGGILFGPVAGAIAAAIGGFIGQIIAPHTAWLGIATFLVGTINAFAAGLVSRGKWIWVVLIIAIGTTLWFLTEIGRDAAIFPTVFYSLGIVAALIGGIFSRVLFSNEKVFLKGLGIWFAAFAGFVTAASIANFFGIILIQIPAEVWRFLVFVSPWERAFFALGAAIIGVPLLLSLPKIGMDVGPTWGTKYLQEQEQEE